MKPLDIKVLKKIKEIFGLRMSNETYVDNKSGLIGSPGISEEELEMALIVSFSKEDIESTDIGELYYLARDVVALPKLIDFLSEIKDEDPVDVDLVKNIESDIADIEAVKKIVS